MKQQFLDILFDDDEDQENGNSGDSDPDSRYTDEEYDQATRWYVGRRKVSNIIVSNVVLVGRIV